MEEKIYYEMYQEELRDITPCSSEEQKELVEKLLQGDETASMRLVEGNLARVITIAQQYADKGVLIEDLVAEGNLALTLAVGAYVAGDFDEFVKEAIQNAMADVVAEQERYGETGINLAAMLNVLDEVSKRLAEEYGREATVTEIAEKMKMSEEQIKQLTKMALDAVSASVPGESEEEMYVEEDMISDENIVYDENGEEINLKANENLYRNTAVELDLEKEFDFDTDSELDI